MYAQTTYPMNNPARPSAIHWALVSRKLSTFCMAQPLIDGSTLQNPVAASPLARRRRRRVGRRRRRRDLADPILEHQFLAVDLHAHGRDITVDKSGSDQFRAVHR